jgi:hypothetical protein
MSFQVGDIVKLRGCTGHQQVTKAGSSVISTKYLNTRHRYYDRRVSDFELIKQPKPRPMEDHMNTLFQTKEPKPRYGRFIAENPEGKTVLMMNNGYEDFDPKDITEVIPYTVQIEFSNGQTHHYAIQEGQLEVDDLVVMGIHLGRVRKVDTKVRSLKKLAKDLRRVATLKV